MTQDELYAELCGWRDAVLPAGRRRYVELLDRGTNGYFVSCTEVRTAGDGEEYMASMCEPLLLMLDLASPRAVAEMLNLVEVAITEFEKEREIEPLRIH